MAIKVFCPSCNSKKTVVDNNCLVCFNCGFSTKKLKVEKKI